MESNKEKISRISVSLPENLLRDLDKMVADKSCDSRSQLIVDMIHQQLSQHHQDEGNNIMAGTINIVFDHSVPNLQKQLAEINYQHIDEVISSLNVNLTESRTMSVVLVQGPAARLKDIANQMISQRGVITGKLLLSTAIIPQVHPLPQSDEQPALELGGA